MAERQEATFDWAKATARERDAWLAEHLYRRRVWWVEGPGDKRNPFWMTASGSRLVPLFTYRLDLAFEVQGLCATAVGWSRYAQTLWRLMFASEDFSWEKVWGIANADVEQRCRAAHLVLTAAMSNAESRGDELHVRVETPGLKR